MNSTKLNLIFQIIVLLILLCLAAMPVYFINIRAAMASYYHYWGTNYYLNGLLSLSYQSWQEALANNNPYIDATWQDYATVLQQSYQAGLIFQPIEKTHLEGIAVMRKAIAQHPLNYFYYNFLAEYYNVFFKFDKNYLAEADKLSAKAWELSPNRQQILYTMAKTALLRSDTKRGYDLFKQAVDLNPLAGDPHFYFGLLAFERGDKAKGLEEIKLARKLGREPHNLQEAILLGNIIGDLGDYDTAIAIYKNALKNAKNAPDYHEKSLDIKLKIAISYYYKGDRADARLAFIELNKDVDLKKSAVYPLIKDSLMELGLNF